MNLFKDIYKFFNYLSFVDVVFLGAIILLLILIVTLIYFIRINKDVLKEDDFFPPSKGSSNNNHHEENNKGINSEQVVSDNSKVLENEEEYNDEEAELIDLEGLTKKLQNEQNENRISFTEYEKDQEEKAIISYDELLQKHNKYAINYEKEEVIDDLIIKKVNLNDLVNKNEEEDFKDQIRVISYQKEEDFLNALKELNRLLN